MIKKALLVLAIAVAIGPVWADRAVLEAYMAAEAANTRGDYEAELRITRPWADKGEAWAQLWLGESFRLGQGVPQDYAEAMKWWRLAAAQGSSLAQYALGVGYFNGQGVLKDHTEAVKWWRLAAAQGNASAQFNLGVGYFNGQGVPQDYLKAHLWLNLAGAQGNADAAKNRDVVAKRMSIQQLAEAQKMARDCLERKLKGCD